MRPVVEGRGLENAKRDKVRTRRVDDDLYRVSSVNTRKEGREPYKVRRFNGGWRCECRWAVGGGTGCKHVVAVLRREDRDGRSAVEMLPPIDPLYQPEYDDDFGEVEEQLLLAFLGPWYVLAAQRKAREAARNAKDAVRNGAEASPNGRAGSRSKGAG